MSYDINFWKQDKPLDLSAQEIYERLSERQPVEGLVKLPVDEILDRLTVAFPDFHRKESFPTARTSEGSVEFIWSDYNFRFDIRGGICADCQKLVDIMADYGCPMYDPRSSGAMTPMAELHLGKSRGSRTHLPSRKRRSSASSGSFCQRLP